MTIIAIVGMAGAGKSEVARIFGQHGCTRIRFGDVTDDEVKRQGLELNEENERSAREQIREKYGMAAYARLNLSRIDLASKQSPVVIDGLYSWEEYTFLKDYYVDSLFILAVWASPETRHCRLAVRHERPLSSEEAARRDKAEVEKLNKSGPIAIADFTILNEYSLKSLEKEVRRAIATMRRPA